LFGNLFVWSPGADKLLLADRGAIEDARRHFILRVGEVVGIIWICFKVEFILGGQSLVADSRCWRAATLSLGADAVSSYVQPPSEALYWYCDDVPLPPFSISGLVPGIGEEAIAGGQASSTVKKDLIAFCYILLGTFCLFLGLVC
jgi:hypothetical protein